jgi:hydroxyacylglutathione hydrolase
MNITILPALADNYIYVLESGDAVAIVDPGEAKPVLDWVAQTGKTPTHILLTHHHSDHIGGAAELARQFGAKIIGATTDAHRLPPLDRAMEPGETIAIGDSETRIIAVPGHTLGHIAWWFERAKCAFAGDALFSLGCGRIFEGNPTMMWQSLQALAALPPETALYCGHEYTAANARFALSLDPENPVIQRLAQRPVPTMPTILKDELAANPFLRCADPSFTASLGLGEKSPVEVFAALRQRKDHFR